MHTVRQIAAVSRRTGVFSPGQPDADSIRGRAFFYIGHFFPQNPTVFVRKGNKFSVSGLIF
jgi:hypothetical protein